MSEYDRIAQVMHYLGEHQLEPLDLATLAKYAGMSQPELHQLFADWAGVPCQDILNCLTLAHAKELLREGKMVLDAASGILPSDPCRLNNLTVLLEAVPSSQLESSSTDWTIAAGFADSPFGRCLIAEGQRGICHLSFGDSEDGATEWAGLSEQWPQAVLQRDDANAVRLAGVIFQHRGQTQPLRAYVRGKPFQIQVWQALLQIRPGTLVSYGHLAANIGKPKAARAVGTAVGQNPLAYLIPCHRIIRDTGVIGNYGCGKIRKRVMLAWEIANYPAKVR